MVKLYFAAYKQHMQCTGGKDVAAHSSRAWQHDASHTLAYEIPLLHYQVLRCAAFSQMQWYRRVKWVVVVAIHAAQRGAVLPCCTGHAWRCRSFIVQPIDLADAVEALVLKVL